MDMLPAYALYDMAIQGLRRNYNWAPLLSKVRSTVSSGIDKMKTNSNNNNV